MTVATYEAPDTTTQTASDYKAAIDGAHSVHHHITGAFAPHAQATPVMAITLDAGTIIKADGTLVSQAAQNTSTITAPVTNPRIDRIVINATTGAVAIIAGSEAASPTAPAITAGYFPVAQIALTTASTTITNSMITDERTFIQPAALAHNQPHNYAVASGTDTYTATLSPAPAALVTGTTYHVTFTNANATTTPTLNLNSLGAKTIKKEGSAALVAGDIPASHAGILRYDGTDMILMNPKWPTNVPLTRTQRTRVVGVNSALVSITAGAGGATVTTVNCGTVVAGDFIQVTGSMQHQKAAAAGRTRIEITIEASSTATVVEDASGVGPGIANTCYQEAGAVYLVSVSGEIHVDTGGTLVLRLIGTSYGSDGSVAANSARLTARVKVGA